MQKPCALQQDFLLGHLPWATSHQNNCKQLEPGWNWTSACLTDQFRTNMQIADGSELLRARAGVLYTVVQVHKYVHNIICIYIIICLYISWLHVHVYLNIVI